MTDAEIFKIADDYASEKVPDPKVVMSINKFDLRQGFIDGFKAALNRGKRESIRTVERDHALSITGNFFDEVFG
jgi:hypothetical protein